VSAADVHPSAGFDFGELSRQYLAVRGGHAEYATACRVVAPFREEKK